MKKDIILAGVGGQGIVSIAATIGYAAVAENLFFKQSEVHGMSQRGGAVQSHFRLSDKEIFSDLIPLGKADIIISVEPMEALRYLPWLSKNGWLVTNTEPYINIPDYPSLDSIMTEFSKIQNVIALNADKIAKELKSSKSANMVVLGAASPYLDIKFEQLEKAIHTLFGRKGEKIVEDNIKALRAGKDYKP
ncbi:indolepyruvate oxidoreductase subunit beta [Bacteroidetes/Chlorobi group bacterium ChocPot_Mid]|jgi:indolepyruvate ferredoxin oxidoreductase beta subunit|nr:MAG: indolepyruvate oxidoreductase subunit beta [Bacteroidetes/Chlorobi group bacterium ChocPot_Mid]